MAMNDAHDVNKMTEDIGISTRDVLRFVRSQGLWIAGAIIIGAVLGYLYSTTRPKQWQATTVLQIGQIAADSEGLGNALIEPPQRALVRVQLEPFKDRLLNELGLPPQMGGNANSDLVRGTLTAQILPTTDLIQLSVRGFSPEIARTTLQHAQDQLIQIHQAIANPSIQDLRKQLASLDQDIATVQARRQLIASHSMARVEGGSPTANTTDVLLGNLLGATEDGLLDSMKRRRDALSMRLGATHTFNTRPLDEIAISQRPVSPRASVYTSLGALVGLTFGLVLSIGRFLRWGRSFRSAPSHVK